MAKKVDIYNTLEVISSAETDIYSEEYRLLLANLANEFIQKDIYLSSKDFKSFLESVQNIDIEIYDKDLALEIDRLVNNEAGNHRFRFWVHVWYILIADPKKTDTDALEENFQAARSAAISLTTVSDKAVRLHSWANRRKYRRGSYGGFGQSSAKQYDRAKRNYEIASSKAMKERSCLLGYLEGLRQNLSIKMEYDIEYGSRTQRLENEATALRGGFILLIALILCLFLYLRWAYFANV